MLEYERQAQKEGARFIAGVDEAGRGPLAGPVVVAGVIMPLKEDELIVGVNDSKKLSEKKRDLLYDQIMERALDVQVAVIDCEEIDLVNILNATKNGMFQCIKGFKQVDKVLIDAVKLNTEVSTLSIIHGDALSYSIAAASIVAKVTRDRLMLEYDKKYPQYNFAKHKGYGTAEHIDLLKQYGPCPIHRKTFITHFVEV
ncbi:MAG: ribonuclease HII [Corallococcus sp.]|nr:ribonuclease HII [Corallococcus sp.]MCM1359474.1 ribonuclease HII [Corallococcus sp.]MCM1394714.1 ribonuclease HII [Corallococcus sp.]